MNIYREKWSTSPSLWEIGRTTSFCISYRRYWLHIYTMCKISYNTLTYELNFHMHGGILRLYWWNGQERIQPIPLEGVHSASPKSNWNKGVNTYIWKKLNRNDGNKINLWIFFAYAHHIVFLSSPAYSWPSRCRWTRKHSIHNNYSRFLPQALYEK